MPIVELNGMSVHYHVDDFSTPWEDRDPILLIHSAGGNLNRWTQWMPTLAKSRKVIRFDIRGHGFTSTGSTIDSVDQIIQDIHHLLEFLHVKRTHVIGASAGGVIAIALTSELSTSVASLTLVASTPFLANTTINTRTWGEILKTQGTEAWLRADINLRFNSHTPHQVKDWYAQQGAKTPAQTVISLQSILLAENYSEILHSIETPTLILASKVDGITPPEAQLALHNLLPNSKLKWFENVGHNLKLEIPELLAQITSDFINNSEI